MNVGISSNIVVSHVFLIVIHPHYAFTNSSNHILGLNLSMNVSVVTTIVSNLMLMLNHWNIEASTVVE